MRMLKYCLLLMIMLFGVTACGLLATPEPAGVGEKAERGYAATAPVIAALESYKEAVGGYPPNLDLLVPGYLLKVPTEVNGELIVYRSTGSSFELIFRYFGPGMNECTYTPAKKWRCNGAY